MFKIVENRQPFADFHFFQTQTENGRPIAKEAWTEKKTAGGDISETETVKMGSIEVLERKLNTLKRQESLNEEKIVEKREEISERQIIKDHVRKIFGKILLLKLQWKIYF